MAGREVYVEFLVQGSYVKVTAIDPVSGLEATIMGPAGAAKSALSDAAVRKLKYLIDKKNGGG